jgi:hypothetical protein
MFLIDLIVALVVAVVISSLFFFGFRRQGPWKSFLLFLVVVFLTAWAGGVWINQAAEPGFGVYWVAFFMVGLIVALLLAAIPPVETGSTVEFKREGEPTMADRTRAILALDVFLIVLMIILGGAVLVRYVS